MTPTLWAVVGATGTGKTGLSLDLAERLRAERGGGDCAAEIVNADAMQLYRGMDIGTAKLPVEERRGIPHHLFDALDVTDEATVAWYQPIVRDTIERIHARGRDAILVGGSGLYVSSAIFDFRFPPRDEALREELEAELASGGAEPLLQRLRELDAEAADSVDRRNPRRVVRALEVALLVRTRRERDASASRSRVETPHTAAQKFTLPERPRPWKPDTRVIGIRAPRAELVERLDRRTERMWADGMLDEVRALIPAGIERGRTASRAIGYAQALAQLRGEIGEAEAIAETQQLTRRYARRQVSWFKRYPDAIWLDAPDGYRLDLRY